MKESLFSPFLNYGKIVCGALYSGLVGDCAAAIGTGTL